MYSATWVWFFGVCFWEVYVCFNLLLCFQDLHVDVQNFSSAFVNNPHFLKRQYLCGCECIHILFVDFRVLNLTHILGLLCSYLLYPLVCFLFFFFLEYVWYVHCVSLSYSLIAIAALGNTSIFTYLPFLFRGENN